MPKSGKNKSRFATFLGKIGTALLKLFRGDFLIFLLFLGITFFLWWSQTMSKNYETEIKIPVKVTSIPDEVRMTVPPVSQLTVSLNGKGTALRKSGRRGERNVLNVSNSLFAMHQGHASLSTQRLRDSLSAFLPSSVYIRSIEPDSLVYQFVGQRVMMLPVEFVGTVESQDQFFLEHISFKPDSVKVSVLLTDTLEHHVVADAGTVVLSADTIVRTVEIKPVANAILDATSVQMSVISQQYTEKTLEIPITGVNFPDDVLLKSFPSKVAMSVWVKMSEYEKITASDFQVVVDYNDIAGNESSRATLRIYSQPANVRNVRLQTRSVDYLMETKLY